MISYLCFARSPAAHESAPRMPSPKAKASVGANEARPNIRRRGSASATFLFGSSIAGLRENGCRVGRGKKHTRLQNRQAISVELAPFEHRQKLLFG
jgi:hypothetical protein